VIPPSESASSSPEIDSAPRVASLADRFEILGRGFCGDADSNQVSVASHPALVLASSPVSLVVLPPMDLGPGPATVDVSCAKHPAPPFPVTFAELDLDADSSPLKRENLTFLYYLAKSRSKPAILLPEIAELSGGNLIRFPAVAARKTSPASI
jgi:hypothetical protein